MQDGHNIILVTENKNEENILLDDNFEPLLTDFGISKFVPTEESIRQSNDGKLATCRNTLEYFQCVVGSHTGKKIKTIGGKFYG